MIVDCRTFKGPRSVTNGLRGIKHAFLKCIFILIVADCTRVLSVSQIKIKKNEVNTLLRSISKTVGGNIEIKYVLAWCGKHTPDVCSSILDNLVFIILSITQSY